MKEKILITGTAGFIGYHLAEKMISEGHQVIGVDNINDYYDVNLKLARLDLLKKYKEKHKFYEASLENEADINEIFRIEKPTIIVNLAAQAGVRYSLKNPKAYISSNIVGFGNILENCRNHNVKHLVYASSSSVYGLNTKMPFSVQDAVDKPISLYAASKKSNELMAHSYSHLFGIPTTGLRFFTVYGPWGRPDMAMYLFTKAIYEGRQIDVYNFGNMKRDFTYIDDIIEGVKRVIYNPPKPNPKWKQKDLSGSSAPYKIYNIGNNQPVELLKLIETIEDNIGIKAEKNLLPIQAGDVTETFADIDDLIKDIGFKPSTPIETGIKNFVEWYKGFYGV